MKKVQSLLEEANDLFERAEITAQERPETGHRLFLQGIVLLLRAFLNAKGVEATGDLQGLFAECKELEPEFGDIEEVVEYFLKIDFTDLDIEDLSDSANEIWDFVIDYMNVAD